MYYISLLVVFCNTILLESLPSALVCFGSVTAYQTMTPKGKDGSVEVSIKLNGYNQLVLDKNEVKNPVSGNGIVINSNECLFKLLPP